MTWLLIVRYTTVKTKVMIYVCRLWFNIHKFKNIGAEIVTTNEITRTTVGVVR